MFFKFLMNIGIIWGVLNNIDDCILFSDFDLIGLVCSFLWNF